MVSPQDEDEELRRAIERWKQGDSRGFTEIYRRCFPLVREIVHLRLGGDLRLATDSVDVVQDVFVNLFRAPPPEGIGRPVELKAYLAEAVLNRLRDIHRNEHCQKRDRGRDVSPEARSEILKRMERDEPTPSQVSMSREIYQRYLSAVSKLSEREREAIVLAKHVGLSSEQAARRMGFESAGAFRMLLSRALAKVTIEISEAD